MEIFDKFDIFASFRNPPSFSSEDIIINGHGNKLISLDDLMPLGEWTEAFAANKWSGYIFSREDIIPIVNLASRIYLRQKYGITLKEESKYACLKRADVKQVKEIEKELDLEKNEGNIFNTALKAF